MNNEYSQLIVAFQNHYNTPGWKSMGSYCPSCCVSMKNPARHGYFVGEKSAVIYWLCEECDKDDCEVLARVTANLSGRYGEMYYSIVYGDLDATEDWRARVLQ